MSFPHRTRCCFGLLSRRDGWQDRGKLEPTYPGGDIERTIVHAYCYTRLRIGLEDGIPFCYCPRCLVKVTRTPAREASTA